MAKTIPFPRQPRRTKTMLLPIPRAVADELALQVHLALSALRRAGGARRDAQTLLHALVLAQSIAQAGYGELETTLVHAADAAMIACFARGDETDDWYLDDASFESLSGLVTLYDRQLQSAPLWALTEASNRLERMTVPEQPRRMRA